MGTERSWVVTVASTGASLPDWSTAQLVAPAPPDGEGQILSAAQSEGVSIYLSARGELPFRVGQRYALRLEEIAGDA